MTVAFGTLIVAHDTSARNSGLESMRQARVPSPVPTENQIRTY